MLDSACGGTFFNKIEDETKALFDTLSENSQHHASFDRRAPVNPFSAPKKEDIYMVGHSVGVHDQFLVDRSRKLGQLLLGQSNTPVASVQEVCALCACFSHFVSDWPMAPQYLEFVQDQVNEFQGFQTQVMTPFQVPKTLGGRIILIFPESHKTQPLHHLLKIKS